jgi:maltooligosyltrehalose trehalohydrolase
MKGKPRSGPDRTGNESCFFEGVSPAQELALRARRWPVGAEVRPQGGTMFRVWAPAHREITVVLEDASGATLVERPLHPENGGYFSAVIDEASVGSLYRFRLGGAGDRVPDPASRFQPSGPSGPSQIVDPAAFSWSDDAWTGISIERQVLYEMHVGTFTSQGTWRAALAHLAALADFGITAIEMMPIAEFAGRRGWGYDGVDLYAPSHLYGTPDDLRRFVDQAHRSGLGVVLDVVYNHFGPEGNYLSRFSPRYFSTRHTTEWGQAINFDDDAAPVREFIAGNAAYWIDEFHFDGLRVDATQQIFDASPTHVLAEISARARVAAPRRSICLFAENEPQDTRILRPLEQGGYGFDGLWNDDFHHTAAVALTGRREAYFQDYLGTAQEFLSMAKWGFLYQGQRYSWQGKRRGTPTRGLEPHRFVTFLENHDQVANALSLRGERLRQRASPGMYRALTALWLLSPGTPMFFQGQEFGASSPFLYFADHTGALGAAVRRGRAGFMRQFRSVASRDAVGALPDPAADDTFLRCTLRDDERSADGDVMRLHRDLLRLRRDDPIFRQPFRREWMDGAVLSRRAFVMRWFAGAPQESWSTQSDSRDRLVVVNLDVDLHVEPAPEPLLAPPAGTAWAILWSSESAAYGGAGTSPLEQEDGWRIPGHATVVLDARPV